MQINSEVQKHPNARVFSFGIGTSVNRFLLEKIAEEGRGAAEFVTLADDASDAARRFHERIRAPLLTDIELAWSGVPVADVYPRRVPDLFSAAPLVICGRYTKGGLAILSLHAVSGAGEFNRRLTLQLPDRATQHDVLPKLWARNRIDALMAEDFTGMQRGSPRADLRDAIMELGLQHRLMTQFTSFVAVEDRIVTDGSRTKTVPVPVDMPEGVSYEGVFGSSGLASGQRVAGVSGIVGGVTGGVLGGIAPPPAPSRPDSPRYVAPTDIPKSVAPIKVGGSVQESKLLRKVVPTYSRFIMETRLSAIVILEVSVAEDGSVTEVRVLKGHPLLNEAAIQAVKQWQYSPTLLNGTPVPVMVTAMIEFRGPQQPRLDPAVSMIIARIKAGTAPDQSENAFVVGRKAEVELTVDDMSGQAKAKLSALGVEILAVPLPGPIVCRMPVEKLESLLDLEFVRFVAPHKTGNPSASPIRK